MSVNQKGDALTPISSMADTDVLIVVTNPGQPNAQTQIITKANLSAQFGGTYTNEMAQDAVGGILTDTATIDFTYDDAGNIITADVKANSIDVTKQHASTTSVFFGRSSAGAGAGQEIAFTSPGLAMLQAVDVPAQKALLGAGNASGLATLDNNGDVTSAQIPFNTIKCGLVINGLGDSITARCLAQPGDASLANLPAWQASTAYTTGVSVVQNGGIPYVCTQSGTSAGSGGPTGQGTSIVDNTVRWNYRYPQMLKSGTSWLTWVEAFSCGRVVFRLSDGYTGLINQLIKVIVVNGGTGYLPGDTVTLNSMGGATATLNISGGAITSVTITNPGNNANAGGSGSYTITTAGGTGAILAMAGTPSGTFATQGAWTQDAIGYLPDAVASAVDIFVVHIGTNDVNNNISYSTITTNLRTIWETLILAGKRVVVIPIMPKSSTITTLQNATLQRVNKFIRAYYRMESWANPLGMKIALADPTGFWTDGASLVNGAVGGTSAVYPAVTVDGLHPSPRGAQFAAWEILQALQRDLGISVFDYSPRSYSCSDGYDVVRNPGGNCLEGIPWIASSAYVTGQICSLGGNLYYVVTAGTSASSGGPTGTGAGITDGTVTWNYAGRKQGLSTFISGTAGTQAAKAGITYSGQIATGWTITRIAGTGAGTIMQQIESPWSNGQKGQRQVTSFSLGGGTSVEHWTIFGSFTCAQLGMIAADFGANSFYAECEIEVSGLNNAQYLYLALLDGTSNAQTEAGNTLNSGFTGSINNILFSAGEQIEWPNNGKLLLKTDPLFLPAWMTTATSLFLEMYMGFDASGAAGTATGTFKINYIAIKKYGVA